jgi:transglutaminase-like putative cysteine protease
MKPSPIRARAVAAALALAAGLALPSSAASKAAARPAAPTVLDLPRPPQPEWFGVYLLGKKAGFARSSVEVVTRGGRRVLVARLEFTIKANVGPKSVERTIVDEKVYEAKPSGRLLTFSSTQSGDGGDRTVEGRCTAQGCTAALTTSGEKRELKLPRFHETAEQADASRLAAATRREITGEQLELEQLRVRKMVDRFVGKARLAAGGVESEALLVDELEVGDRAATRVSLTPDGRVVEMRLGDLIERPEPEEVARRIDGNVDVLDTARIALPGPLPRDVPGRVVFRLSGVPPGFQVPDARQTWAPGSDGAVALTVTARRPAAADPARDAARLQGTAGVSQELAELVAPTSQVDSDAPQIAKLAREVVGDTRGVYAASVKLVHFVYGRLEKAYGVSRDRASEVLALGKGDCTEHALLFTALARAVGIPARQVQGVVYARYDDGVPALYWHAWVEVKSGDEWIAVDPTFDQPVADPTHIALGRGARPGETMQNDTVAVMGALKVLSAQAQPPG